MSLSTVVRCDVPGCKTPLGLQSRLVELKLVSLTGDHCYASPFHTDALHICAGCASAREGRAFVAARFEAFAARSGEARR